MHLQLVIQRLTEDMKLSTLWIMWSLWKNRNAVLYARKHEVLSTLIQIAAEEAKQWRQINDLGPPLNTTSVTRRALAERWQQPLQRTIKCNISAN